MTRTVAVTGATGFIGRAFCEAADEANVPVIAIGRDRGSLAALPSSVEPRWVDDLCNGEQTIAALRGADIVLHLADRADRMEAARSGSPSERLSLALATAARTVRPEAVVFASSIYATLDEQGQANPYGAAKRAAEQCLRGAGCPLIILRLPPIYGPGEKGSVGALAALVRKGLPLPFGAAHAPRDYLHIENLVRLLLTIARGPSAVLKAADGIRLEPCDGQPIATSQLVRFLGEVQGRPARLLPVPPALMMMLARLVGQTDRIKAAFEPLQVEGNETPASLFGWTPHRVMPDSLAYLADR